jgi:glycosyltransferase involved in cell wall biosynthesis
MKISIIIPTYNEEKIICYTLQKLREELKGDYEIIVIDDYSSDNTHYLVKNMLEDFPNLRLTTNQHKKGFANTLQIGFDLASNEIVIPVMADFCDDVKMIPYMYSKIIEGYDIVCGSRYIKGGKRAGGHFLKTFLSMSFNKFAHSITRIPNTDLTNPFKAYRKCILRNIELRSKGFEISTEIILKAYYAGCKITELPTVWTERHLGKSHFALFRDGIKFIKIFLFTVLRV